MNYYNNHIHIIFLSASFRRPFESVLRNEKMAGTRSSPPSSSAPVPERVWLEVARRYGVEGVQEAQAAALRALGFRWSEGVEGESGDERAAAPGDAGEAADEGGVALRFADAYAYDSSPGFIEMQPVSPPSPTSSEKPRRDILGSADDEGAGCYINLVSPTGGCPDVIVVEEVPRRPAERASEGGETATRIPFSSLCNLPSGERWEPDRIAAPCGVDEGAQPCIPREEQLTMEQRLGAFIRGRRELYEDILLYCGVNVDDLHQEIRERSDIQVSRRALIAYLEGEGVRAERTGSWRR